MLDSAQSASRATLCETFHKHGIRASLLVLIVAAWPVCALAQAPAATPAHGEAQKPAAPVEQAAPTTPAAPAAAGDHQPAPATQPATPPVPAHGAASQPDAGHAQPAHGAQAEHGEAEHHGESPLAFAARIGNFLILAGGLYYFLRKPLSDYLTGRSQQISGDLITAKETSATAATTIAEIDRKLQALPAEIAQLKARGAEEIAAEEARIRQSADAERHRLIEQTRREIDLQVRLATRELTEQAAALAVELASTQIKQTITPADQQRLIDRYVTQVRQAHD